MSLTLRNALGHFATGVTIITMLDHAGRRIGMTANSFASLSLDPPLILWSLARTSVNHAAFCATRYFAVHVLESHQSAIARQFATRDIDRFRELATGTGLHGMPLLPEFHARFQCENASCHDGGDHTIIVGRVLCFDERHGDPLLFYRGKFATVMPVAPDPVVAQARRE